MTFLNSLYTELIIQNSQNICDFYYLLNPVFTQLILLICDSYMIVNIMWASQTRFPSQSHFRVSIPKSAGDVEVSSLAQYHGELQTCYYWKLCTIKGNK